ncbi:MAG: DUF6174 domain-containing protein [Actinomycetota bacterium]
MARRGGRTGVLLTGAALVAVACSPDDPVSNDPVTFPPTSFAAPAPAESTSTLPGDENGDELEPPVPETTTTLPPALTRAEAAVEAARGQWEGLGVVDYEVTFVTVVDGVGSAQRVATVIGGDIASITESAGSRDAEGPVTVDDESLPHPVTVDGWLRRLASYVDDEIDHTVTFDDLTGSPAFVEVGPGESADPYRYLQVSIRALDLSVEERQDEVSETEEERLAAAIERWETTRTESLASGYAVTYEANCNTCPAVGTQRVVVVEGVPVDPSGEPLELDDSPIGATVDQWFDFLRFVIGDVDAYDVQFDPTTGVPFFIDIDARREIDGDEFRLDVLQIEPLETETGS